MQVQDQDPLAPQGGDNSGQPTVQQGRDTAPPAPGFSPGNLYDSWNKWIDKPNNRAALMQFGIAMLQPVGMGETGVSHFANAVGAAGQAGQRVTEQQQAQEKHESEIDTRETRARAAETSANAAEMRAIYGQENAQLRAQNAQTSNLARMLSAQAAARAKYDNYQLITPKGEQLSYSDWIKTPEGVQAMTEAGGTPGVATAPSTTGAPGATPAGGTGTAQQALAYPRFQTMFQEAKAAAAAGNKVAAEQRLRATLAAHMAPGEFEKLLTMLGVR